MSSKRSSSCVLSAPGAAFADHDTAFADHDTAFAGDDAAFADEPAFANAEAAFADHDVAAAAYAAPVPAALETGLAPGRTATGEPGADQRQQWHRLILERLQHLSPLA